MTSNITSLQNNKSILQNFLWKFSERFCTQGLQFVIQIILARILLPSDYGILALVVVFITRTSY